MKNDSGFTLSEMVIAMALGIAGLVLFSSGLLAITKSSFFVQETTTRLELYRSLKNAISNSQSLQKTAAMNPLLNAVIKNDFTATGPMNTNQFFEISLYDSSGIKLAGTTMDPVLYLLDGTKCPSSMTFGTGKCVVSATASFMAAGLPYGLHYGYFSSVKTLPVNGFTTINYPISSPGVRPELILINFQIRFFKRPGSIERKPVSASVFVSIKDLGF